MDREQLLRREPPADDVAAVRAHRQGQCVLGYRIWGALRLGTIGDGHISARDPERPDHFWLLGYGVPYPQATVDDLVLVAPDGSVAEGDRAINWAAYCIHHPLHDARPDLVSAAHVHTPYGTPWSAMVEPLRMVSQESCCFAGDQAVWDDDTLDVIELEDGRRLAAAVGDARLGILRNHGLVTTGASVAEAVGWFAVAERAAETNLKARDGGKAIDDAPARGIYEGGAGRPARGIEAFRWLVRSLL
ncbi:MAG: class II aldolase/adducin family protein [Acidimicrobiales bacterium]